MKMMFQLLKTVAGKYFLVWAVGLLWLNASAVAQDFTATASPATVPVGGQVQVSFTLTTNGSGFRAPSFPDFNILMGPSQSTSMQIINGSVSQSLSSTYVVLGVRDGTF